MEFNCKML